MSFVTQAVILSQAAVPLTLQPGKSFRLFPGVHQLPPKSTQPSIFRVTLTTIHGLRQRKQISMPAPTTAPKLWQPAMAQSNLIQPPVLLISATNFYLPQQAA